MNHPSPSVADTSTNILNQLSASFGTSLPILPKAFLWVLSRILGAVFVLLYKYAGFSLLQLFVPYASTKEVTVNGRTLIPLVEWGRLLGVGDPLAATRAVLDVTVTVTNQTGTLQAGAQLLRQDTGVVYVSTGPVELNAATVTVRVRAASDQTGGSGLGVLGNLQVADALSFASPLPNISRDAVVATVETTAADAESWEDYRDRILERASAKPQGGSYADYRIWAREVAGIVGVYPYTGLNPGEVDVYVEASVASSGSADGIPTGPQLAAVLASINYDVDGMATRRPANAAPNVYAITRTAYDLTVTGLTGPANLQADITAAATNYYLEREPFIVGLSILPRKDLVLQSSLVGIVDQIVNAQGGTVGTVVQSNGVGEAPVATLGRGEKSKLGAITFL